MSCRSPIERARRIHPRDQQHVALADEFEHRPQFSSALRAGAALLLRADDVAAGGAQRALLDRKILIGSTHPRVADNGHGRSASVSQ
jgi:hypothetical protein